MIIGRMLNRVINIFTGFFGISTIVLMLVIYFNNACAGALMSPDTAYAIGSVRNYCTLATVFCAGTEFTLKRNIILAVVFAGIILAVLVFMIYTDVTYAP